MNWNCLELGVDGDRMDRDDVAAGRFPYAAGVRTLLGGGRSIDSVNSPESLISPTNDSHIMALSAVGGMNTNFGLKF